MEGHTAKLTTDELLACRQQLTHLLQAEDPFSLLAYYARCGVHRALHYPDLAITDAYKALLLADEALDPDAEYHAQAHRSIAALLADGGVRLSNFTPFLPPDVTALLSRLTSPAARRHRSDDDDDDDPAHVATAILREAQSCTARLLASLKCFRSAYTVIQNAIRAHGGVPHPQHAETKRHVLSLISDHFTSRGESFDADDFVVDRLPDRGYVRREVYPWNTHELDRMSDPGLAFLNQELRAVAPMLRVQVAALPDLAGPAASGRTTRQLGLFAQSDVSPGQRVLCERSLLTANMREHEPLCDACASELPALDSSADPNATLGPVPCPECDDVAFCSESCLEAAQESYHGSVCGMDVESIGKDVPAARAADALYVQLMFRTMAMSLTQDVHPLDLKDVKFIWGDFQRRQDEAQDAPDDTPCTLPYDFDSQVLQPLHLLEQLDVSIFEPPHQLAETWVYNTLLAKFRGTASARISPRDGRPEVAAVHPLWCLANHSCDPNVEWQWSGVIEFNARGKSIDWTRRNADGALVETIPGRPTGIQKGDEIMNHYVDIELPVKDRREWGQGALGGSCECERCIWEAGDSSTPLDIPRSDKTPP